MRACRNKQSLGITAATGKQLVRVMPIKREAALQTSAKIRKMLEPAAVRRKLIAIVQAVTQSNALERKVRERCRRFTDCKPRMRPALEENDIVAEHGKHASKQ